MRERRWFLASLLALAVVMAIAATAGWLFASRASRSAPERRSGPDLPPVASPVAPVGSVDPSVDLSAPGAVCDAFAAALSTRDTAIDSGPADAYTRAAAYASPALTDAILASGPLPKRGAEWVELTAHRGLTRVSVLPFAGELPPDQRDVAYRVAVVNVVPVGRDGWHGNPDRRVVACTLHRAGPRWHVTAYDLG
jgi:hypothetical protein